MPHLSIFNQVTEHNNDSTLSVSDHLPEISGCGLHGTLSYDECSLLLVTLSIAITTSPTSFITNSYMNKNGVNVVIPFSSQSHTPLVS